MVSFSGDDNWFHEEVLVDKKIGVKKSILNKISSKGYDARILSISTRSNGDNTICDVFFSEKRTQKRKKRYFVKMFKG